MHARSRVPFALSTLGAIVLIALECARHGRSSEAQALPDRAAPAAPHLACGEAVHDFGRVLEGDSLRHVFQISNTGSALLRLGPVDSAYSCAARSPPQEVRPGESADLIVECGTAGRSTKMVDKLVVHSDDSTSPPLTLQIEAWIEPLLAFASRTVELNAAFGQNDAEIDPLTGKYAGKARLALPAHEPGAPKITIVESHNGQPQGLRFALAGARVGSGAGQVVVSTGLETPKTLTVLWSWRVQSNLTVDPTNPFIDLRAPSGPAVVLHVSSTRADFRLRDAQVIEGPFQAHVAGEPGVRQYSVEVGVQESLLPASDRGWVGILRLMTNDPAEPSKDVPLFAMGAPTQNARSPPQ